MRVLIACEFSGAVRDAFTAAGHDACSCDLLPAETPGEHFQMDIMEFLYPREFDLIIAHPPCTYLTVPGNRWYAGTQLREDALSWTRALWQMMTARAPRVCLENPVGVLSSRWQKATQYVQPWQFGQPESKRTGLWLHRLPKLVPTHEKPEKIEQRVWRMGPSLERQRERSRFFPGIAKAMAEQWGSL